MILTTNLHLGTRIDKEKIIAPTQKKISNSFSANSENEDPFLCNECRQYGYCIKKIYKDNSFISDKEIANMVNVRSEVSNTSKTGKKLQQAHDLFHQDEYEQASYLYLDILQTRNNCDETRIGLSVAYYFLRKYEEAANTVINLSNWRYADFINRFSKKCEIKVKNITIPNYSGNKS